MTINILIATLAAGVSSAQSLDWQVTANWHQTIFQPDVRGTLVIDNGGVEFRSAQGTRRWQYEEIQSFDLAGGEFTLYSYMRRPWHQPGTRPFHFTLSDPVPSEVAALLTTRVARPVRNGEPVPVAATIAEIPAHRRTWRGGSNGTLRFKDDGIDYLAKDRRDSKSWRWSDMETLANPNPYEFRVTAFREIAEFDLKQPLARNLFDQLWDRLYSTNLNLAAAGEEVHHR